ncbi:uncharacterized protein TNCV_3569911 [Trichonephila clavipes]|nr:uncharacterized protein TNCV_3569911 [Trichonephila clavipes]
MSFLLKKVDDLEGQCNVRYIGNCKGGDFTPVCNWLLGYVVEVYHGSVGKGIIQLFFILGISLSPIWGEAVYQALYFSIPFYGIGVLCILNGIFVATMLPEPDQKISKQDMSIISWTNKRRMFVYFVVVLTTFVYSGFLVVVLDPYLKQGPKNLGLSFKPVPGRGSRVVWVSDRGLLCHGFEPSTTKRPAV